MRRDLQALEQYFNRGFRLAVSGYFYPIRGLISEKTDPANGLIFYRNIGRINMQVWEAALKKKSPSGFEAAIGFSLKISYKLLALARIVKEEDALEKARSESLAHPP